MTCIACMDLNHQDQKVSFKTNFSSSKDSNHVPWLISDVFIDGEDEHEHEEEAGPAMEVPDVVPDHQQLVSFELSIKKMGFSQRAHPS